MRAEQELLSGVAVTAFRLNGLVLELAEDLTRPVGLTAAWWQVLGAVLPDPLPVSGIAREMGVTRQSVQRIADLLARRGLVEFADNPAHRRAKLVVATEAGRQAVSRIDPAHADAARRFVAALGRERAAEALAALESLVAAFDEVLEGHEGADRP